MSLPGGEKRGMPGGRDGEGGGVGWWDVGGGGGGGGSAYAINANYNAALLGGQIKCGC